MKNRPLIITASYSNYVKRCMDLKIHTTQGIMVDCVERIRGLKINHDQVYYESDAGLLKDIDKIYDEIIIKTDKERQSEC